MELKSRHAFSLMVMVGTILCAEFCSGAGFALYEGSARGNALAGALVGRGDDPSALFYNPAGITQLPCIQMMTGATFIMPSTDVTTRTPAGAITTSSLDKLWVVPHAYMTYQATDKVWLGLALFSPFGLGTEFPENWPGRYNSYKAVIQSLNINPNIAFKLNDKVSLATGLDFTYLTLALKQKIATQSIFGQNIGDIDSSLQGDAVGVGLNFALHYKPYDWLKLGVSYRSQMTGNVSGDAKFLRPLGTPAGLFTNTNFNISTTLPDEVYFGAAFYPIKKLSLEVGGIWTHWGTFNALTIEYANPILPGVPTVSKSKDWKDVWRFLVGIEYNATEWLDLRAGFAWDQEPVDNNFVDYLLPANDRYIFSFGPGFHWRNWTLDLSYTYVLIVDRDNVLARLTDGVLLSSFNNGNAHQVGCSISYKY